MNHKTIILVAVVCLGLSIVSPAQNTQKLTGQQVHHLALLGQLWGFLKYYHPQVAKGKFDWDEQLFRIIPLVKGAKDMPDSLCRILPGNIGYINLGRLDVAKVDSVMSLIKNCKGIIFDIRYRPRNTLTYILHNLIDQKKPFAKFLRPNLDYPGTYLWDKTLPWVGPGSPGKKLFHYTGQVAILVDERTLSHSEFTAMAFQTVPGCVTIGSQTSGADGNIITGLAWPGSVYSSFSALGVFYPDGTPTQRVGVKVDIEVRPTAKGIREGRDEVLERAIQYIQDKR